MAASDDGVPQYYCFICGTPIGVDSFLDHLRWSETHGIGHKEYLPEHATSWTTEFRVLVQYPQPTEDENDEGEEVKYRLLHRSQATPPLDEDTGQVYWDQGMIIDPDIRQSYTIYYFEYETYRLYETNTNELDDNGNRIKFGYPMHVNCHNQLQQLIEYSDNKKHLGLLNLNKLWRMLRSLEDEDYGCKLDLRKQNMENYGYGGAEEYGGWCRTWESWHASQRRQNYNALPLGWKYFVNPGLLIHNDDPSSRELDSTGLNLQAEEFGKRLKNVHRSDLADEIKVKLIREIHEEHRNICDVEISKLIARRLNPLIADARDWNGQMEMKTDLEVLKESMNSCFLNPETTVPMTTELPADEQGSFDGSYMCRFPQEIVLQILNYLPTMAIIYALEARSTSSSQANSSSSSISTSVLPDTLPSTFWNSRFNNPFEMAYLYGEIAGDLPVNQKTAQEVGVNINPGDYRMLYYYLGTLSDLKRDVQYPLDESDLIEWQDDTTNLSDSIYLPDPGFDGESGWSRKDVRNASLSNQKRISKCVEGLLKIYNEFEEGDETSQERV